MLYFCHGVLLKLFQLLPFSQSAQSTVAPVLACLTFHGEPAQGGLWLAGVRLFRGLLHFGVAVASIQDPHQTLNMTTIHEDEQVAKLERGEALQKVCQRLKLAAWSVFQVAEQSTEDNRRSPSSCPRHTCHILEDAIISLAVPHRIERVAPAMAATVS